MHNNASYNVTLSPYWHVCHLWLGHGVVPICLLAPLYIPESPAALSPTHISVTWSTHIGGIWWTWHGIRLGFWYLFHAPHYVPNIMNYIIDFIITTHAGVGMMDMTSCFRSFQLSSIVVYPLFPTALFPKHVHLRHHCLYYRTCWWISPLTRCRQSFNHQCRKWLRQYMDLFIAAWHTDSIGFDARTHGSDWIRYCSTLTRVWPWHSRFDSI